MVPNEEEMFYVEVKRFSALLKGIMSKLVVDFNCMKCLNFERNTNVNLIKDYEKKKDFCIVLISSILSNVKEDLIVYRCLCCKRNYQKMFDESL